jgi:ABC-type tungstate transport system substrate-binding protein
MERSTMNPDPRPAAVIRELERSYTERVNMAVAEDRYDLVDEFAAAFARELSELQAVAA